MCRRQDSRIARVVAAAMLTGTLLLVEIVPPILADGNLLVNPGFEGPAQPVGEAREVVVAQGWGPWWPEGSPEQMAEGYLKGPSFYPHDITVWPSGKEWGPSRVHSGRFSQKIFSTYATHHAGLWQRVEVPVGEEVCFSAWVVVWSSEKDDQTRSSKNGEYRVSIGINPWGNSDPTSEQIEWTPPLEAYDEWVQLAITTTTRANWVCVFTRGQVKHRVENNNAWWDDARLALPRPPKPSPIASTPTSEYAPRPVGEVLLDRLFLLAGPGAEYDSLAVLPVGVEVGLLARAAGGVWLKALTPDGLVGWVHSGFLAIPRGVVALLPVAAPPPSATPTPPSTCTPTLTPTPSHTPVPTSTPMPTPTPTPTPVPILTHTPTSTVTSPPTAPPAPTPTVGVILPRFPTEQEKTLPRPPNWTTRLRDALAPVMVLLVALISMGVLAMIWGRRR